ncbi:sensor histidine kinase [Aquimarina rhabdastrellae]
MNNNKLITIVSISFSLLVNIPRIVFLFGNTDMVVNIFLEISITDTIFRIISLFGFCFIILKVNIEWGQNWFKKRIFIKSCAISILMVFLWVTGFRIFDVIVNSGGSSTLYPRLNIFVHLFIMIMLLVISTTIKLNNQAKLDAIEKEQLKQQNLQNELQVLKNQLNPHFLFNSLNSLSLLVREDQKAAGKFINKLSVLYRYILQSKERDLVSIEEELKFLESYVYLIEQRYRENFKINIAIDKILFQKKIPSLALQLLVENAVKHNEISSNKPLVVTIYNDERNLIVKNKIQEKIGQIQSTHTGLSNLNNRFKLVLNKEITLKKDEDCFIVKLPIS